MNVWTQAREAAAIRLHCGVRPKLLQLQPHARTTSWITSYCAALVAMVVPACFHPSYDHPTCGLGGECPDGFTCMQPNNVCESNTARSFDSAADFAAGQLINMTIEPRGSITPDAYTYGGLVAYGLQNKALWTTSDTDWSKVDNAMPSGAGLWRGESIMSVCTGLCMSDLRYLGLKKSNNVVMTIWLEGEIWLNAMEKQQFSLQVGGVAFFEIASPGTTDYQRVVESSNSATSSYQPPETGWYPVRIGFATNEAGNFQFLHSDTNGSPIAWTRNRLRARTGELSGTLRTVFFQQTLGGGDIGVPPVPHFEDTDLLSLTTFDPVPQGTTNPWDWSARYFGQVYIEQQSYYTLKIVSDGGNRGWLGGRYDESNWVRDSFQQTGSGSNPDATTDVSALLSPGWNDIVVDYTHVDGDQRLQVQLDGPDFPSIEVPRDRLRPVEPADDRLAYGNDDINHTVFDGGGSANPATANMPVVGYAGETVVTLDLLYEVKSP